MKPRGFIGIDFGTSNSHFAFTEIEQDPPQAIPIELGANGSASTTTCVLWRQPAETEQHIYLYGDQAVEEWMMLDEIEQRDYKFSASFKPDLVASERARHDAWAFLRRAYLEMRESRQPRAIGSDEGMPVVIGVPAQIGDEHRHITAGIAQTAGFGVVECVEEPLGALAYHLVRGQISDAEAHNGVIVVDFGGGTLDVALVDEDGIREPWGNPILGGRLFDDLFFQWVCDEEKASEFDDDELLVGWHIGCRKLKERFSQHWERKVQQDGVIDFDDFRGRAEIRDGSSLGRLRNASLQEFRERAMHYQPSIIARKYFQQLGGDIGQLARDKPVDLFAMVRDAITESHNLTAGRDFSAVILTGGSGSWPFMRDIVSELFAIDASKILKSSSPEKTIGEGLAIYKAVKYRNKTVKGDLQRDIPELKSAIIKKVEEKAQEFVNSATDTVTERLMTEVRSAYQGWYENGGSLRTIEQELRQRCAVIPVNEMLNQQLQQWLPELQSVAVKTVVNWLRRRNINPQNADDVELITEHTQADIALNIDIDLGDDIGEYLTIVLSIVVGVIAGSIAGGGGTALLMSGPVGWLVGAIVGAGAVWAGKEALKDQVEKAIKDYEFGSKSLTALRMVFSGEDLQKKLDEGEFELRQRLLEKIQVQVGGYHDQLTAYADKATDQALLQFGILDKFK